MGQNGILLGESKTLSDSGCLAVDMLVKTADLSKSDSWY